jgi:hypothetical protein
MFTNKDRELNRKYRHYIHSPFQLEHQGVIIKCNEHGKITIHQDHENEEFSEVTCAASLFTKVYKMLAASRKVVWRDEPFNDDEGLPHEVLPEEEE